MHTLKMLMGTLIVALAIAAVAAPTSLARPLDLNTPKPQENAPAQSAGYPRGQVYWSYEYEAPRPKEHAATTQDDGSWMIAGLAVTGGCLLLGGAVAVSRTRLRARRARVAA